MKLFFGDTNKFKVMQHVFEELFKIEHLTKKGILLNIDLGKNHRFTIRRFWGTQRNGYYWERRESNWDDGLKAVFRYIVIHNLCFDFITWDRSRVGLQNYGTVSERNEK